MDRGVPDAGGFLVALSLLLLFGRQRLVHLITDLVPVAMMGLVVEHNDVLAAHKFARDALNHLAVRLGPDLLAFVACVATLDDSGRELVALEGLAVVQGVIVGDDEPRLADPVQEIGRDEAQALVNVLRVGRNQHAEPVADRDARSDHQERVREALRVRPPRLVHRVPRDDHPHQCSLAGPGRHLGGESVQTGVRLSVGIGKLLLEPSRRDFRQVDERLNRFTLAEEQRSGTARLAPMEEETLRLGSHPPLAGW